MLTSALLMAIPTIPKMAPKMTTRRASYFSAMIRAAGAGIERVEERVGEKCFSGNTNV